MEKKRIVKKKKIYKTDNDFSFSNSDKRHKKRKLQNDIRNIKCYSKADWKRLINRFFQMTHSELAEFLDPERRRAKTCAELVLASIIAHTISRGDHQRLNFLLDRAIGKVTEKIELSAPTPFIIEKLNGDQVALGAKLNDGDDDDELTFEAVFHSGNRKQLEE